MNVPDEENIAKWRKVGRRQNTSSRVYCRELAADWYRRSCFPVLRGFSAFDSVIQMVSEVGECKVLS